MTNVEPPLSVGIIVGVKLKVCNTCKVELPYDKFWVSRRSKDGYQYQCKECNVAYKLGRSEELTAYRIQYEIANKEKRDAQRHARRAKDPEKFHRDANSRTFKYMYGITMDERDAMVETQGGKCALCGVDEIGLINGNKKLCVDHDHVTGKVRSMLCNNCNSGIGQLQDDPELLRKAALYIENHKVLQKGSNVLL